MQDHMPFRANVIRRGDDSVEIRWNPAAADPGVTIYRGDSPDRIEIDTPVAHVNDGHSVMLSGLDPGRPHFFKLVAADGAGLIVGERRPAVEGAPNLRDLGGYEAKDGRCVKWGTIFRSSNLARLTDRGLDQIKRLGIHLVCDFRTEAEVARSPQPVPGLGGARLSCGFRFSTVNSSPRLFSIGSEKGIMPGSPRSSCSRATSRAWSVITMCGRGFSTFWSDARMPAAALPLHRRQRPHRRRRRPDPAGLGRARGNGGPGLRPVRRVQRRPCARPSTTISARFGVDIAKVEPYFTAPESRIRALLEHVNRPVWLGRRLSGEAGRDREKTIALLRDDSLGVTAWNFHRGPYTHSQVLQAS